MNKTSEILTRLLNAKKQVIFYGPPGTGKTYNAKKFAVEFLMNEASEPSDIEPDLSNPIFLKLTEYIESLPHVEKENLGGQFRYSSQSKISGKSPGLVWISPPSPNSKSVTLWIRRKGDQGYPIELTSKLSNIKDLTGDYYRIPQIVCNENEVPIVIELIKFAYEQL